MECEQLYHFEFEPSSVFELDECFLETTFPSLHNSNPIFPNTSGDEISSDVDIERLLQIETDLMDFDFIDQDIVFGDETNQILQENVEIGEEEPNPCLKGIREELMENSKLVDLLLTGAEAVEAENQALASNIIARLNDVLSYHENGDEPFNRLALFFTQGLHYKSINAPQDFCQNPVSKQSTNTLSAFQILQELSPYFKFPHFTANQAILEATMNDKEVHIIDFDIMEGIQWPPLMVDLATRKYASLKITAITSDDQSSSMEKTGRRLKDFADSINLPFMFDQMVMMNEEDFERIEVGGVLIANCMTHQLHMPHRRFSMVKTFLGGMTKLSPKIVVLVEEELFNFSKIPSMSFAEFFCEALHHYTALSDSLASGLCGGYEVALKVIEKEFLRIRILESVRHFPCERAERECWGDGYANSLKGFRPIPMSSCNVSQAKYLVSLFSGGYWVQNEGCRLALCWKSRPLTTASIWVPRPARSTSF